MANKGGKIYGFNDAWTKNEMMARRMHEEEGQYEGYKSKRIKKVESPYGNHMHVHEDAALGLDGADFHDGGDRLTKLKEEALPNGDVNVYFQNADSGGTYVLTGYKVGEGRHRIGRLRRTYSFGGGK